MNQINFHNSLCKAITDISKITREQWTGKTRKFSDCRSIEIEYLIRQCNLKKSEAARLVNRHRCTVIHHLKRYDNMIAFNRQFKVLVAKIYEKVNQN